MGEMEGMGKEVSQVHKDLRERREWLVLMGQSGHRVNQDNQVFKVVKERQECRDCRDCWESKAHQQEEQSTLAGAGPPAPLTRELSYSMPAELQGHLSSSKEEWQTYLCLPDDPDQVPYESGVQGESYIAGVDYWFESRQPLASRNYHNAPCAVCYVPTRITAVMILAKTQCPTNWTLEYIRYLMAEYRDHSRTMFECVDKDPESLPGLASDNHPRDARFHLVEP